MGRAPEGDLGGPEWAEPERKPHIWAALKAREHARANRISPFILLDYRGHPLVRAHLTSTRRRRRVASVVCVAVPLAVFCAAAAAAVMVPQRALIAPWERAVTMGAGLFICFWPLLMFTGAALGAAGSTLAEREGDMAVQLVLSRMGRRPIAAAKVLPAALPYLLGAAAALPLYLALGSSPDLLIGREFPGPQLLWPLRMLVPLHLGGLWSLKLTLPGGLLGAVMCLSDLAVVWAAAHWGAAYAVRMGKLFLVGFYLGLRLVVLGLLVLAGFAAACLVGLLAAAPLMPLDPVPEFVVAWGTFFGALALMGLWWIYLRFGPVGAALLGFEHFDRLADEDFKPLLRETLSWRAWREHVWTGRR